MFMTQLTMQNCVDDNWCQNYLTDKTRRITPLVQSVDSTLLNVEFRDACNQSFSSGKLVFRSKSNIPSINSVRIINIWDSEETYDKFAIIARRDEVFAAYDKVGLKYILERFRDIDVVKEVDNIINAEGELIIHYCSPEYKTDKMGVIGDPLKKRP